MRAEGEEKDKRREEKEKKKEKESHMDTLNGQTTMNPLGYLPNALLKILLHLQKCSQTRTNQL